MSGKRVGEYRSAEGYDDSSNKEGVSSAVVTLKSVLSLFSHCRNALLSTRHRAMCLEEAFNGFAAGEAHRVPLIESCGDGHVGF